MSDHLDRDRSAAVTDQPRLRRVMYSEGALLAVARCNDCDWSGQMKPAECKAHVSETGHTVNRTRTIRHTFFLVE